MTIYILNNDASKTSDMLDKKLEENNPLSMFYKPTHVGDILEYGVDNNYEHQSKQK